MYENEIDVITLLTDIVKEFTKNFEILVYERENINASRYKALFAIRMRSKDISQDLISKIKYLNARDGKKVFFDGTKVDVHNDMEVSFIFVSAEIKCDL
jgi:hypothetical protein